LRPKSKLGFGLSGIAGLVSTRKQQALLSMALDRGITHFDVAPYYGAGDAERVLGHFAKRHRDYLTIATKVGLNARFSSSGMRVVRHMARRVFKVVPRLNSMVATLTSGTPPRINYSPEYLRTSVDRSLHELSIERIDVLLLHDWPAETALSEPVILALHKLVAEGKVGVLGIASSPQDALAVLRSDHNIYGAVQFENSLMRPAVDVISSASSAHVITHRALAVTYSILKRLLRFRPGLRDIWRRELGVDPGEESVLADLLVRWALARNPNGTVLFSTTKPAHLEANAKLLREPTLAAGDLSRLETLVSEVHSVAMTIGMDF
jgi:D-threo-aldose 1-dehydrogenase